MKLKCRALPGLPCWLAPAYFWSDFCLLRAKEVRISDLKTMPTFADMKQYLRVGLGSGLDSLVRNIAYFFMIIRLVNTIGPTEIGGYYLTVQILWGFMLVPVLAFADSAKALIANASDDWSASGDCGFLPWQSPLL